MATTEHIGLMTNVDESGNKQLLYPITKPEAVDGLEEDTDQRIVNKVVYSGGKNLLNVPEYLYINSSTSVLARELRIKNQLPAGNYLVSVENFTSDNSGEQHLSLYFIDIEGNEIYSGVVFHQNQKTTRAVTLSKAVQEVRFYVQTADDTYTITKPMIRLSTETDDTYEPYYEKGLAELNRAVMHGSRNLLNNTAQSKTINGVTFTVNSDGSVTMNGTATSDSNFPIFGSAWNDTSKVLWLDASKNYILSKGTANAIVYSRDAINDKNYATPLNGQITLQNAACLTYVYIQVPAGRTVSYETIYPMIRLAGTSDIYEPYYKGLLDLTRKGFKLLWKNASPTSEFVTQTIYLDLSKYQYILVCSRFATTDYGCEYILIKIGDYGFSMFCSGQSGTVFSRKIEAYSNRILFASGYKDKSLANNVCVPVEVYCFEGAI